MSRRRFLKSTGALTTAAVVGRPSPSAAQGKRTFRWAFNAGETGFDPAQISDLYSNYIVSNIIESPLQYDYLARPAELRPRTAAAMPEVSSDFRTLTVRIRPGIQFQDDPAFKGQRRELTAHDYVYSVKRIYDPRWKSPLYTTIGSSRLLGLEDLRKQAQATGKFDYAREVEGLRALDRFTFQVKLEQPDPRFIHNMADCRMFGAVAREVIEEYGDDIMAHPVGTGPFVLTQWKRSSFMVLERSPTFREELYDARPRADDRRAQAVAKALRGKRLPIVDRVEISVIDEAQPRWLSFLNGEQDCVNVPVEFINQAVPFGKVAPALARQGIELDRMINPDVVITFFNMDDPTIGGYTPEKVALRRAISLGYDTDEEIRLVRNDSMLPAQSPVPPGMIGYDPMFKSDMNRFDRASARALLDTYGFVDRDGDGWRENPDGSPLVLAMSTQSSQTDRRFNEVWKRHMTAIGLNMDFRVNQWPENAKSARTGKLMMWSLGWSATAPDPDTFFSLAFGPNKGAPNYARFVNAEYDRLYEIQRTAPDGAERQAAMYELKRIFVTYLPYKVHGHRFVNDVMHPWLVGYQRHPFARDFFKYIDVDAGGRHGA